MATSSIIENIRVNNPKALEEFASALDAAENNYHPRTDEERSGVITDPERIRSIVKKALNKKGIQL